MSAEQKFGEKRAKLLREMAEDRNVPGDRGILRPGGKSLILKRITKRDLLSETAQDLSSLSLDGKEKAKVTSEEVITLEVVAIGAQVTQTDAKVGEWVVAYPAVCTPISTLYIICPEDAVAGVIRPD